MSYETLTSKAAALKADVHVYDRRQCVPAANTHIFQVGCPGNQIRANGAIRLLVSGCGRGGTHYTWEMLNRLGIKLAHEGLAEDGGVSWMYAFVSNTGYPVENSRKLLGKLHSQRGKLHGQRGKLHGQRFCTVFHEVRHPLRVLSSVMENDHPYFDTFDRFKATMAPGICGSYGAQECNKVQKLQREMRWWLAVNQQMERYAHLRFRVEDTSNRVLCKLADFPEWLCNSDGRFHTTTETEVQPIVEPKPASAEGGGSGGQAAAATEAEKLPVSWEKLEAIDPELAGQIKAKCLEYGYDLDPSKTPQNKASRNFAAGRSLRAW